MATEFFAEGGFDVAITLTPGDSGILQVIVDGDTIYDKSAEGNETPTLKPRQGVEGRDPREARRRSDHGSLRTGAQAAY